MIPGVPYDAEIEYLESTGTQYIDTGIVPSHLHSAMCTFQLRSPLDTSADSSGCLFGCFRSWGNAGWAPVFVLQRNEIFNSWGNSFQLRQNIPFPQNTDKWNAITFGAGYTEVFGLRIGPNTNVSPPQNTAYVFCCNYNGTAWGLGTAKRISLFQLYDGSTLVRDFIPVRVGQTGYMYDRVTRRLFGNKGTGSFVLGHDVAKPVMGLWGMKQSTFPMDYIQDGLVAHFDAVCNGPNGEHVTNTNKWYDLTGNEEPLVTWSNIIPQWTDNSVLNIRFEMKNAAKSRNYSSSGFTEELVTYAGWANPDLYGVLGNGLVDCNMLESNGRYRFGVFDRYPAILTSSTVVNSKNVKYISFSVTSNGIGTAYIGGTSLVVPISNSSNRFTVLSGSHSIGFGTNANSKYCKGMHAYRIYNRALSQAEIARNYAIDKARFNLP